MSNIQKYLVFALFLLAIGTSAFAQKTENLQTNKDSQLNKWFSVYDFNLAKFKNPSVEFGPVARWWWQ